MEAPITTEITAAGPFYLAEESQPENTSTKHTRRLHVSFPSRLSEADSRCGSPRCPPGCR